MKGMLTAGWCMWLAVAGSALGDVTGFKVFADSLIVQSRNGSEEQRKHQSKGFPASTNVTPVEATTSLPDDGASSSPSWGGFNRVVANAPQFNQALPTDFVLNLAAGSAETDVSLSLGATGRQTRTIEVKPSDFPLPLPVGTSLNLQSTFLLDGTLAAVVPTTAGSAEGLHVTLGLELAKGEASLFEGTVVLTGQADGTVTSQAEGFADSAFTFLPVDLPGLATVYLLTFDDTEIDYEYLSQVGDTFDLEASITIDADVPSGLAGGASFGTVPTELITLTQTLFGDTEVNSLAAAAPEPTSLVLLLTAAGLAWRRSTRG